MKLRNILTLVLYVITFSGTAHAATIKGNGDVTHEVRELNEFSMLEVSGSFSVSYSAANTSKCEVKADSNLMDIIKTDVDGKTLEIYVSEGYSTHNQIFVTCQSKDITSIASNGSGSVEASNIQSQDLNLSLNGSGDMVLSGRANVLKAKIRGSGSVMARDLAVENSDLVIVGSGNVYSSTANASSVSIKGSGDVVFSDRPKSISQNIYGSGSIKVH